MSVSQLRTGSLLASGRHVFGLSIGLGRLERLPISELLDVRDYV